MIAVADARARLLALVVPMPETMVPLRHACGRVLARDIAATAPQPPFAASAMDGYALSGSPTPGDTFAIVGEAAAGRPFDGMPNPGEAIRIFTGAPVPQGADRIVIQEDVSRDGDVITLTAAQDEGTHIRPAGADFDAGFTLAAPRPLDPAAIALAAAMDHPVLPVRRRPRIAILMTGDELAPPGTPLAPGMVRASNGYGLVAMVEDAGAEARLLPIARDTPHGLRAALDLAGDADLIITIGGASVGDHDLVAATAGEAGLDLAFHKVAMRPGKPLLAGRLGRAVLIGLPGNPVSSMVCGAIFILPMIEAMLGMPPGPHLRHAPLAAPVAANGPREHYMRATLDAEGALTILPRQDSSLLSVLAASDALVMRPPGDPARVIGEALPYLPIGPRH